MGRFPSMPFGGSDPFRISRGCAARVMVPDVLPAPSTFEERSKFITERRCLGSMCLGLLRGARIFALAALAAAVPVSAAIAAPLLAGAAKVEITNTEAGPVN